MASTASGKGSAKGTSSGWVNPAWAGVQGPGTTTPLLKAKFDTNYVNPAWAGYIDANKKSGKSYQQQNTDAVATYGSGAYVINYLNKEKQKQKKEQTKPAPNPFTPAKYASPTTMQFNLPPHAWSLPVEPRRFDTSVSNFGISNVDNSTRRAIMWYYADATGVSKNGILTPSNDPSTAKTNGTTKSIDENTHWGFQFLWNPQQFSSVLTRNANVVPSALDAHAALSGLFTAMEAIQLTIVIDRVNDFACFKSSYSPYSASPASTFANYYNAGGTAGKLQDIPALIDDLMKRGTMADIEFIYKMINGSGRSDSSGTNLVWVNALNRQTADLSFLSPTAIALQLGPNPDSLSYVGWVESLSINHTMFTEDMIPIHSEITMSFNAFSRVSLLSKG